MDYGEVLGRAWRIIWKHKILWIFGIFAGCSRGGSGSGGSGSRVSAPGGGPSGQTEFPQLERLFTQFSDWIGSHPWFWVLVAILVLALVALSLWLGTMGRIGLIRGASLADGGAERLGFGEIWTGSMPFFWRVLLLSILVGLVFLIVLLPIILGGVLFSTFTLGLGLLCFLPFICLLIPVGLVVGLVIQLSEIGIVVENLSIRDGLRRGWEVFQRHLGPVLLVWLILLIIGFVVGLVIALPILIVLVPAVIAYGFQEGQAGASFTPLIIGGLCFAAYLPVLLVLNGILTAYLQSTWTLTYLRLTHRKEALEAPVIPAPNA